MYFNLTYMPKGNVVPVSTHILCHVHTMYLSDEKKDNWCCM